MSESLRLLQEIALQPTTQQEIEDIKPIFFGGIDLAKRVDSSCITILELDHGILKQRAIYKWPHVKYGIVARDTEKFHSKIPMELLGIDRQGVGDAAIEMFGAYSLPLVPISTTGNTKIDIIHIIRILFNIGKLKIARGSELEKELVEQQETVTKAGNLKYSHPSGRHDDMFWSLGYACYVALPYMVNMPPAIIKTGFRKQVFDSNDFEKMINDLMGSDAELERFNF